MFFLRTALIVNGSPPLFGLLVVSDRATAGVYEDGCFPALKGFLSDRGYDLELLEITPDGIKSVNRALKKHVDSGQYDVVLTAGGTGVAPRDTTPEATLPLLDRVIPGIAEAMRAASLEITPNAMLSRAVAGVRNRTIIINLPGSPKGAVENLSSVLDGIVHGSALIRDTGGDARCDNA